MRKNQVLSAVTTLTDTEGVSFVVDEECDHFFRGNFYKRSVFPVGNELWLVDNGVKRRLADFIWEIWNERITPGHTAVLKDDPRDYRLQNLQLVKVPKEKKVA